MVPPLTTREHRKGGTTGRSNGEFDSGSIVFGILAECLCEQSGTCGNVGMELGKELRHRDFLQIWKSSLYRLKPRDGISFFRRKFRHSKEEREERIHFWIYFHLKSKRRS